MTTEGVQMYAEQVITKYYEFILHLNRKMRKKITELKIKARTT